MAHRSIGQERFGFAGPTRPASSLDALGELIDWSQVAALLDPPYSATTGEPAGPPLAMFKALLLSIWYDLSDVKLAEPLDERASFRRNHGDPEWSESACLMTFAFVWAKIDCPVRGGHPGPGGRGRIEKMPVV